MSRDRCGSARDLSHIHRGALELTLSEEGVGEGGGVVVGAPRLHFPAGTAAAELRGRGDDRRVGDGGDGLSALAVVGGGADRVVRGAGGSGGEEEDERGEHSAGAHGCRSPCGSGLLSYRRASPEGKREVSAGCGAASLLLARRIKPFSRPSMICTRPDRKVCLGCQGQRMASPL